MTNLAVTPTRISALFVAVFLAVAPLGAAAAPAQERPDNRGRLALDIYALRGLQDTSAKLYLSVVSQNAQQAPQEQFATVRVEVRAPDGRPQSTTSYTDVSAPDGQAVIDLGDVPLSEAVSVRAELAAEKAGDREVLNGQTAVTEFAINQRRVVVPDFEGYGAQMNGYLYTAQNDPKKGTGNVPPLDVENLEAKVKNLKPGLVRIFLSPASYQPANRNLMDSFYKTVELAQGAGADVNITWWFIDRAPKDNPAVQQSLMEQDMQEFAGTLVDLVANHGLTAVRQITIQNEVDTSWVKQPLYEQYYRLLDQKLRNAGIRDHIKFVGGDLVVNNQLSWFDYMATHMGDVLDGWSVHIYWNYWDTAYMQQRLNGILSIYNGIPADERKPLSITEYGVRGVKTLNKQAIKVPDPYRNGALVAVDPGMYLDASGSQTPISETNIAGFEQAWFNMLSANEGFTGLAKWDLYRSQYDFGYQDYSLVGYLFNPPSGEDRWPLRPSYFMQWLMANTTGRHWQVLGNSGASGAKVITPFRSPAGELTLFALISDQTAGSVSVGDLPVGTEFKVLLWNADGSGKVTDGGRVNAGGSGTVSVSVPAGGFVALTAMAGKERLCGYRSSPCAGREVDEPDRGNAD